MKRTCDENATCTAAEVVVADENGSAESVANIMGGQCFGELSLWMVYKRMRARIHSCTSTRSWPMMCTQIGTHAHENVYNHNTNTQNVNTIGLLLSPLPSHPLPPPPSTLSLVAPSSPCLSISLSPFLPPLLSPIPCFLCPSLPLARSLARQHIYRNAGVRHRSRQKPSVSSSCLPRTTFSTL